MGEGGRRGGRWLVRSCPGLGRPVRAGRGGGRRERDGAKRAAAPVRGRERKEWEMGVGAEYGRDRVRRGGVSICFFPGCLDDDAKVSAAYLFRGEHRGKGRGELSLGEQGQKCTCMCL